MIFLAALAAGSLILAQADNPAAVRLDSRRHPRGPSGRGKAVPMAAPAPAESLKAPGIGQDSVWTRVYPAGGDTLFVRYVRHAAGDSLRGFEMVRVTSVHDRAGLRWTGNLGLRPGDAVQAGVDPAMCGRDLNGDGLPDVVVYLSAAGLPLTGQWIEIAGLSGGKVHRWLTRGPRLVPKAIEPHEEHWPTLRSEAPARDRLLELHADSVTDVTGRYPKWLDVRIQSTQVALEGFEARHSYGSDWVTDVLEHTWYLLSAGQKQQARAWFEIHVARGKDRLRPDLRAYLEGQAPALAEEWNTP